MAATLTLDMSNLSESIISIPTVSLFPAPGTTPGDGGYTAIGGVTSTNASGVSELSLQPTVNLNGFDPSNEVIGIDENIANTIDRFDVQIEGSTTTKAIVAGPTPITVSPATISSQSGAAQPGTSTTIDTGNDTFPVNLYQVGNDVWAVQTVADPTTGNSDIQWFELSYSTNAVLQHGLISDPNLSFYDPSVAANSSGQVVIGFNGSDSQQYISAYAVMGTTTSGVTTFGSPILLKQGVADYNVPVTPLTGGTALNEWGNYSNTVPDGDGTANTFWTFQQYASGPNQWSVQFFKLQFSTPTESQPTVTLSSSSGSFNEDGGSVTVTATLASAVSTATTIDLGYNGSAVANIAYTISNPGSVAGNSPVQIVIPAGQTTGSVVLTGASNPSVSGGETVNVAITTVNGATPATPQEVELTIANQTPPGISIQNLTVIENGTTSTADVVVELTNASSNTVTVSYTTANGTAIAGTDYTAETGTLTFAPGTTQQTIPIPLLVDGAATGALQFFVNLSAPSGGTILAGNTSATVTLVEDVPQINIEDTSVVDTSPTTAQVTVQLSQAVAGPLTLTYQTGGGTAIAGTNYISESGTVLFPAGSTSQTIDIPILGDQDQNQTENFLVTLSNPSLGTIIRSQATVTLFNVQPGSLPPDEFDTASGETDFTADTSASGPFAPADPSGAVGPNDIVVFDSDSFQAFNKSTGTVLQSSTLNTFWTNAGLSISSSDYVGQPHVVYDPSTGRWYASALDESIPPGSAGPAVLQNNLLLAVSKTSDPTQGWVGFEFATDPANSGVRADFDSLGFNGSSVVVTANMYNIATGAFVNNAVLSVPKADLTAASPTVARASALFTAAPVPTTTTNTFDPAVDYDASGNEFLLAQSNAGPVLEAVSGGGGPTASVGSPVTVGNSTSTGFITTAPIAAPQPAGAPPLTSGPTVQITGGTGAQLDALSSNFTGTIVQVSGKLWAAQTVYDSSTGTDAVQWFEIDVTPTDANYEKIIQHGVIADASGNLFYYYPSISVDTLGNVVIGFSGSSLTQQISSYAVYGTTAGSVTTFTNPILLKQGTGIYAGFSEANVASASIASSSATFNTTGSSDSATITVNLGAPAGSAGAVVDLGFNGTALANRDYSISNGANSVVNAVGAPIELLIPAGQTSGSIVLTGLGNTAATGDQTISVSVTSINGAAPSAATSTNLTLVDTTATLRAPGGMPLISTENLNAVESSSTTAEVLVRLSEPVLTPVTVNYSTQNGTAIAGTDYTAANSSVTFAPGQTVATIFITLLNNGSEEGKSFTVNFSLPTNGRGTLETSSAIVTLLTSYPTASPGPSVTLSGGGTFAEDGEIPVTVTATLSSAAPTNGSLIVLSFGGTATFGTDYVASNESIFIPAGQTTGSITLSGNDVPIGANNLSVVVGIASIYGANQSTPQTATATLTPGNVASASISGTVTGNSNAPLSGITVYLTSTPVTQYGTEGDFNPSANIFTTTNASGQYSFTELPAGTYTVRELIPSNELVTSPTGNSQTVTLTQAAQSTVSFANTLSAVWGVTARPSSIPTISASSGRSSHSTTTRVPTTSTRGVSRRRSLPLPTSRLTSLLRPARRARSMTQVYNIPVTLTALSNVVSSGVVVTVSIPVQSIATTIYLGFGGTAEGNRDYIVEAGLNASFAEGAPVEVIIPAGQTSGTIELFGLNDFANESATSLTVYVDQINLAAPTISEPTLHLTVGIPSISVENGIGYETGPQATTDVAVPVRLSETLPAGASITVEYTIEPGTPGTPAGTAAATDTVGGAVSRGNDW